MRKKIFVLTVVFLLLLNFVLFAGGRSEKASAGESIDISSISEFSWDMAKGSTVTILLNQHPYADSIVQKIPEFEEKTGIKVRYSIVPEENYFDRVSTSLNSRSGDIDLFMTGIYQIWEYATPGYIQDLDEFVTNSKLTSDEYEIDDFFPGVINSLRWNLRPGEIMGSGPLWGVPMGFEGNDLTINTRIFKENGIEIPETFEEVMDAAKALKGFDGQGTYGIGLRGSRSWATLITSYICAYFNAGAVDFDIEDGRLVSKVNSPEAVDITDKWVRLIKEGGSPTWTSSTWYQASSDLGAGKAAMLLDSNVPSTAQSAPGASQEAGNFQWLRIPLSQGKSEHHNNLWVWALAMNEASKSKLASWIFLQYFTGQEYQLWAAVNTGVLNTPRSSSFNNQEYQSILSSYPGYVDYFNSVIDNTRMLYTPQPYFFETNTEWAATLQNIVGGRFKTTKEGMDHLKDVMDQIVSDVVIE